MIKDMKQTNKKPNKERQDRQMEYSKCAKLCRRSCTLTSTKKNPNQPTVLLSFQTMNEALYIATLREEK